MQHAAERYAARERARFMRPDAARYLRPDAARWIRPDAARYVRPGVDPIAAFTSWDCKYSPNQPRVPGGNPEGGQWTIGGLSSRWRIDPAVVSLGSGQPPDAVVQLAQIGSPVSDIDGLPYYAAGGHHEMPRGVYSKWDLQPETERVFNRSTTGSLPGGRSIDTPEGNLRGHYWDGRGGAHDNYNNAVRELSERFMQENGITPRTMTPDHAKELLTRIRESDVPEIRDYNRAIRMLRRVFRFRFNRE
jgi:hypothetical protein